MPFKCKGNQIHAGLEYEMGPKESGGGEGLCVYLLDPTVPGWDQDFTGSGSLGFVGKKGAIVGVGIDCGGDFSEGAPGSIAVKRASDAKLLCELVRPKVVAPVVRVESRDCTHIPTVCICTTHLPE